MKDSQQQKFNLNQQPVDHVAIMKKSWGLTGKILTGEKTVESRWYKTKRTPWDKIKTGDNIYFKDSGEPVTVRAKVVKVLQFANLTPEKTEEIMTQYGKADLGTSHIMLEIREYITDKNYAIFVFFNNVEQLKKPFEINKIGFGLLAAWITISDINKIKK
jgi:ASC-1-like (ASCH) protein